MRRSLAVAAAVLLLGTTACASTRGARADAPQRVGGPQPRFEFRPSTPPAPMDAEISVLVRADGTPDMSTLAIRGTGTTGHESALRDWVAQSRFRPAKRDGAPVDAVFTTRLQTRSEVRVIRVPVGG